MKKQVNFRIPAETHRRLNVLAAYANESEGRVVERLIEAAWAQRHGGSLPEPQVETQAHV